LKDSYASDRTIFAHSIEGRDDLCYTETAVQLADLRHRIDDRNALVHALQDVLGSDRLFTHPADLIAVDLTGD